MSIMTIVSIILLLFLGVLQSLELWSKSTIKVIMWILFIPFSLYILGYIFSIPHIICNLIFDLGWGEILIWYSAIILFLLPAIIYYGIELSLNFCPNKKVNSITYIILSILFTSIYIFYVWNYGHLSLVNFRSIPHSIGVTIIIILILIFVIIKSLKSYNKKEDNRRKSGI